jgi:FlaA1/EpsC-like NDP-sugar epimerase
LQKFLRYFADQQREVKVLGLLFLDALILSLAVILSFAVRFNLGEWWRQLSLVLAGCVQLVALLLVALFLSGFYRSILRHAGTELLAQALRGMLLGAGGFALYDLLAPGLLLPRSVLVMSVSFGFLGIVAIRLMVRWVVRLHLVEDRGRVKPAAVIYGAGRAGMQLLDSLLASGPYRVVALVDDNFRLQGRSLRGISVFSPESLKVLCEERRVDHILLALPSVNHQRRRAILQRLRLLKVQVQVLPTLDQLLQGGPIAQALQEVSAEDLLGRDEVQPDANLLRADLADRVVMVTGAGGSIGSELCREILKHQPRKLVLLELNEYALYQVSQEFQSFPQVVACLGSVLDSQRVRRVLHEHQVQTVYHAAAYKHVPLVESNPIEGLRNNALGTKALVEACSQSPVRAFVLISTDKAVRPTNVMGASKRIAEQVVQDAARCFPEVKWAMVRFGNVLDSSGSVVPLFRRQIQNRQPVTVTHPEITRYFMSIGEAARLVIQAGALAQGGEVFLLDMGAPVRIRDLATQMIELSGLLPERDIPLRYTGLRPGEKLYEELLIDPQTSQGTAHPRIFCSDEPLPEASLLHTLLHTLEEAVTHHDLDRALEVLHSLVPEYAAEPPPALPLSSRTSQTALLN